ncbi:MAG: hypothetical protein GDA42_10665, partial [Ekhidna sp.]|nr:hypothetical protein [Ekhidna sp.]
MKNFILYLMFGVLFACPTLGQIKLAGVGTRGGGSIFAINSDGSMPEQWKEFETLPGNPIGNLVAANGKLWGMTSEGGANDEGVIFTIDPDGNNFIKIHDFDGENGASPIGSLVFAENKLWGVTERGGASENGTGTIFTIDPSNNAFTKVHDFDGENGALPIGSLVEANGKLWGMTSGGGDNFSGIIFTIDPDGTGFTKVHDFDGAANGMSPIGSLVEANGKLWGMTSSGGGISFSGIIFTIDPDGTGFTKVHDFDGDANGMSPIGSLVEANGKLWGVTERGGSSFSGIIFTINPDDDTFEKVHDFDGDANGGSPRGSLVEANGKLWGMTSGGGDNFSGIIFSINPADNVFTKVHDFDGANGNLPIGSLVEANGKLWGTTVTGGSNDLGVIFSYDDAAEEAEKFQVIRSLTGEIGANPISSLIVVNAPTNNAPMVANEIADRTETAGFDPITLDLANVFTDADNDALTYTANSSATDVVTVAVNNNNLVITYVGTGISTITVTADDSNGGTVEDTFTVKVNAVPTVANEIADRTEMAGFSDITLDLTSVFTDANNDALTYTATSNATDVVTVAVNNNNLVITYAGEGTSTITVTANDSNGGTVEDVFTVTVNAVPTVANEIDDRMEIENFSTITINLEEAGSEVFADADSDELTYTATSSATDVVTVTVSDSDLTITYVGTGISTIT